MNINTAIYSCVNELISGRDVRKATKYLSSTLVVKATRQFKPSARDRSETFVVTYGKPNYAEREAIKKSQKSKLGKSFCLIGTYLQYYPVKCRKAG